MPGGSLLAGQFTRALGALRQLAEQYGMSARGLTLPEGVLETIRDRAPATLGVMHPEKLARPVLESQWANDPTRIVSATPQSFLDLAYPMGQSADDDARVHELQKMLATRTHPDRPINSSMEYYKERYPQFEGFGDVPFLQYARPGADPFAGITGHEGRHRMSAVGELYGYDTPIAIRAMGAHSGHEAAEPLDKALSYPWVLPQEQYEGTPSGDDISSYLQPNLRPLDRAEGGEVHTPTCTCADCDPVNHYTKLLCGP